MHLPRSCLVGCTVQQTFRGFVVLPPSQPDSVGVGRACVFPADQPPQVHACAYSYADRSTDLYSIIEAGLSPHASVYSGPQAES